MYRAIVAQRKDVAQPHDEQDLKRVAPRPRDSERGSSRAV